ncbi:hypothetical protein BDD12DRAFT_802119 [Trichophaea hybrida]|nr:hypothetical protein BDD12DRAFT_802119 [Trichophaea hybrida]
MAFPGPGQNREQPDPRENEQAYWPRDEQPGNERWNFQGWNATPALDAPQNLPGRRSINPAPVSRNTPARHNTSSSWNTTTTNSHNTENNSRTHYANHNEFNRTRFTAPVTFDYNYHSPQPGPRMNARMHGVLQNLVQTISWDILSRHLSVIDQDKYRSRISPFDRNKPENFWISKNIDFAQWELADAPAVLLLCAQYGRGMTEVCSHIIHLTMEQAIRANGPVLYFFCSSAPKARRLTSFTHTLLHQVVSGSSAGEANSIAAAFLSTMVDGCLRLGLPNFREDDPRDTILKRILNDAPDNEQVEALVEAIRKAGLRELSIIVDGLWEGFAAQFIQLIMEGTVEFKALFTTQHNPPENIPYGMLCIEYDKERKECLRFLQHDDTRYDKISDEHYGSLKWLWKHHEYQKWSTSTTSSLLYIEGKPGSGKSTLAKYFEKNFAKRVPNARSSTVVHYFYTFRGTVLESTHENMLRSILHSILKKDESAFFHFQQEFRDYRHRSHSEWPYESLKKVLSSFANHPPENPLYLILDAMDESKEDDRRSVIELICQLCSDANPCNIKVFLASRPVPELAYRIGECHHVITMQDQNKDDIARFTDNFLKTDLQISGKVLRRKAWEYITGNAQGVFVWVSLVRIELLKRVERGRPDAEILKCLEDIPPDLENTYKDMFRRLEERQPEVIQDGIMVFRFVLFALRPLTVLELRDALATLDDCNLSYEDIEQDIPAVKRRIEHCGGSFLEIKENETVQFMHQTAREFLIRTIPDASNLKFEISDMAHKAITATLIQYLMHCFSSPRIRDYFSKIESWSPKDFRAYAEYLNEGPLIEYSIRYINDHHDICGWNKEIAQLLTSLIRQLADNQCSYFLGSFINFRFRSDYEQVIPVNGHQETSENIKYCIFDAAAELKLPHIQEALLLTCTQDAPLAERKTHLIISAQNGLARATRIFLNLNGHKDAKDNSGWTALHHAVENGSEAVVRLLVEEGADKRIRDNRRETALHIAVKKLYDSE